MRLIALLLVCLLAAGTAAQVLTYTVDATKVAGAWNHYFERCVGSDHALMGTRADWQAALRQAREDIGFQQVRFHGMFTDDMSTLLSTSPTVYSFRNIDLVYDFLLSIGMKPYVELRHEDTELATSFMPNALASGNQTIFHYEANITPPKNWSDWTALVTAFAQHAIGRYGLAEVSTWNFEVWNEPNCGFWSGSQAEYFTLYNYTARALKAISPQLRVGGPATCQSGWLSDFLAYVHSTNTPFDFISTHEYPTDPNAAGRDGFRDVLTEARAQVGSLPLYYSEYNDGLYYPTYHDTSYASAFILKTAWDGQIVDTLSWWTFSDVFEEGGLWSTPFGGPTQWGLIDLYGVPKPSYRAFQLLHQSGNESVVMNPTPETYATVGAYAIRDPVKQSLSIFVYNWQVASNSSIATETINITVAGVGSHPNPYMYRIDDQNCNPNLAWQKMGSPTYPTKAQIEALQKASLLNKATVAWQPAGSGAISLQFAIPPQGSVVIIISLKE